ncbi:EAL domain-containing protein [Sphingobium sp. CR2-8]|uniref:sensor domain-containing protein n=1 Tax=Sphingobium sp. CR2-8 TaxID=1306534 RepID=UPI002DB84229|nr:EAL domain-containing protein [Sphingobium sp. CR2-8]MEC3910801.1 EAL domain-containing protein [Sphingobium sp. CR2-8]
MDRFADRRFHDGWLTPGDDVLARNAFPYDNALLLSPVFDRVSPPLLRWVADHRGRLIAVERESDRALPRFVTDPMTLGWRALFSPEDRRTLLAMTRAGDRPQPVTLRIKCADGQARWCLIRMMRLMTPGCQTHWYGTVEDVHDRHDREARILAAALAESCDHYRASVELNPQVPWTADPDGNVQEVGPRWFDLTGMAPHQAAGTGWLGAVHPDDMQRVVAIWRGHLSSGAPLDVEYRIRLRNGGYRWMRARASARRHSNGSVLRWYGTLEDVHAERLAQTALSDSEERFRLAVQSACLGIWDFDCVTGVRTWSAEFRRMLGLGDHQPATTELALAVTHPEDRERLQTMLDAAAAGVVLPNFETTMRIYRADTGALRWIRSTGWTTRSDAGRPLRIVVTFRDVSEENEAEARIRWAATHDPMTRLPNRALWQATLEEMAARATVDGTSFGLLLLDIDDLKRTNDAMGHDAGDALLCAFAERLASVAPIDAVLGRLGGDEFGLVAPSLTDSASLERFSASLIDSLRIPYVHQGRSLHCGVSIGGAVFRDHASRADDLLKAADLALYASKGAGRGRLTLFHSHLRAEAQQRSSMIRMARQVVADDLAIPYYQPRVDMRSGQVLGYEALLRWHHPRMGVQLPGSIAAAFNHGEIAVALTQKMLNAVLNDVQRWLEAGFDPGRVAINAAAADFASGDFADRVLGLLDRAAVPTAHFEIEVTESVFLGRGADQVAQALRHFSDAGVRVALDDFGTGFASLTHLKQFPVDVLKIDRSFVSNIHQDAGNAAIVDAIVKLGGSFGMEVVAEGVETAAEADFLLDQGCIVGQGFHLGRPQPVHAVAPPRAGSKRGQASHKAAPFFPRALAPSVLIYSGSSGPPVDAQACALRSR